MDAFKKSWRTTLGGLLAAVGAIMTAMDSPAMKLWGGVASALGLAIMGVAARDNGVSSEDAGAKPPEAPPAA